MDIKEKYSRKAGVLWYTLERMGNKEAKQMAFYMSVDGKALSTHTAKGFHKIKEKKKKMPKSKKTTMTPFREIIALDRIIRQRTKILEEYGASEDMNGNLYLTQNGKMSQVGSDEATQFLKDLKMNLPELPEIPILSLSAYKLRYALLKRKEERGPARTTPLAKADQFDAFGNSLK